MVFDTIIQRNVRLSEVPSFGQTIIMHDANSKGAITTKSSKELLKKMKQHFKINKWWKKTCTRKRFSALLKNQTQTSQPTVLKYESSCWFGF